MIWPSYFFVWPWTLLKCGDPGIGLLSLSQVRASAQRRLTSLSFELIYLAFLLSRRLRPHSNSKHISVLFCLKDVFVFDSLYNVLSLRLSLSLAFSPSVFLSVWLTVRLFFLLMCIFFQSNPQFQAVQSVVTLSQSFFIQLSIQ